MTSPPASELDGFMSSPPIAEVALPHRGVDQSPPAKEPSFKEMAPPPRPPARGGSRLVGADFVKPEDPEQKSTFETASSQSGAQMPASSYAHTKGLTGPSETKAPQAPLTDSRSNAVTKFEDDNQLHHQDEMHASRPSTPEEQADLKAEPDGLIDAFDWSDLEARYHDMIKERDAVEQQLLQDFDHLSQFFGLWAQAGAVRETDRSYKRLKTQMTYVNHEEQELEGKRQHYIQVVNAFRSALDLLNGS